MRFIRSAVSCLLIATGVAEAQQRPRSDSLPRELVIALLGGSLGSRQVDVHSGLADDSLPAQLFRDAMLLGYADYRVSSTTIAYFPYSPQATLDSIKARLVAAGWTVPQSVTEAERGFVSSYGARPEVICRERMVVVPTVAIRNLGRTLAFISRQGAQGAEVMCGGTRAQSRRMGFSPAADTPLPTLTPPAGMTSHGAGSSGSPDRNSAMRMSTELQGGVPLREILLHYANQFTKAGWKKLEETSTSTIGVVTFEITEKGESWHCARWS